MGKIMDNIMETGKMWGFLFAYPGLEVVGVRYGLNN